MIYILWATIRPLMFIENHMNWIANAKDKDSIRTIVAVNTEKDKYILLEYSENLKVKVVGETIGVCKPIYELSKELKANDDDVCCVLCVCVCVCVCVCMFVSLCMFVCLCLCVCMFVCRYVCMFVCMYVCMNVSI